MDVKERNKQKSRADKLRQLGRPQRILPHEFERASELIREHHRRGMSISMIYDRTGISKTTLGRIVYSPGRAKTLPRQAYERLLVMKFEEPPADAHGARMDVEIVRRIIGALWCVGFTLEWQAEKLGTSGQHMSMITRGANTRVHYSVYCRVVELYREYHTADPREHGLTEQVVSRAKSGALGRGFAPPGCWDEESILDPDAIAEWTGACGTLEGKTIHEREGIPLCGPCTRWKWTRAHHLSYLTFSPEKFEQIFTERRLTVVGIAAALEISAEAVSAWRNGRRSPRPKVLEKLANHLELDPKELAE